MFEPGQSRLHEPGEKCLGSPGIEHFVARVECRQLPDDTNRYGSELGGVGRELRLASSVTPQEREVIRILGGRPSGAYGDPRPFLDRPANSRCSSSPRRSKTDWRISR